MEKLVPHLKMGSRLLAMAASLVPGPLLPVSDSQRGEDHVSFALGHWALQRRDTEKLDKGKKPPCFRWRNERRD